MTINADANPKRRGTVLIIAMVVIFALASMVLVLGRSVRVEAMASANAVAMIQAEAIERGAEEYLKTLAARERDAVLQLEESYFAEIPVGDGLFWVVRPDYGDEDDPRFGLVDEASKLDINAASETALTYLSPDVTPELAAAIADWRDGGENDDVRAGGAEAESYREYQPRNSRFETLEELLLVRGMTTRLLYGDGTATPLGLDSGLSGSGRENIDTIRARGLADYLTVYNRQASTNASGSGDSKVVLRNDSRTRRRSEYDKFVRLVNETFAGDENASKRRAFTQNFQRDSFNFQNLFAFYWQMQGTQNSVDEADFDRIAPQIINSRGDVLTGVVNINTAPRPVLLTLSGWEEADVDTLLNARGAPGARDPGAVAWAAEALRQRSRALTGGSFSVSGTSGVYSADIVAASGNGRGFKRVKIVIDVSSTTPRVIYRRDITSWGWPLDQGILAMLRAGEYQPRTRNALDMDNASIGGRQ